MLRTRKRIGAILLAAALLVGQLGATAYAEGPSSDIGGLCEHHPAHDTAVCGYIKAVPGTPCGYFCEVCAGEPDKDSGKEKPTASGNGLTPPEKTEPETGELGNTGTITVTAFDGMESGVKVQSLPLGAPESDVTLPATLGASGYVVSDGTEPVPTHIQIECVTWKATGEDDTPDAYEEGREKPCNYYFQPVLPEGYELAEGVELPKIEVRYGWGNRAVVPNAQDVVLTVTFNNNGSGGTSINNNEMKDAIDAALAALPVGSDKTTVTTIKLTGDAAYITGNNWRYLQEQYNSNSGWNSLTALDLSGMTRLDAIRNGTGSIMGQATKLTTLTLPNSVTKIGQEAFYGCTGITLNELPVGVTEIGDSAFAGCTGLKLTKLPDGVTEIGRNAFYGCTGITLDALPVGVKQIGEQAFYGCTGITSLTIPDSVTEIGNYAFNSCTKLKSVTFQGKTPPTFGTDIFYGITPQPTVYVPEGATGYPGSLNVQTGVLTVTFASNGTGGKSLDDNEMKDAITAALSSSSADKADIITIKLTGDVTEITGWNWFYLIFLYANYRGWDSLTTLDLSQMTHLTAVKIEVSFVQTTIPNLRTVVLPNGLTEIGNYAFNSCTGLKLDALPDGVIKIGEFAFYSCAGITLKELPSRVKQIGGYAFDGCAGIKLTALPDGVTQIGEEAFSRCTGITRLTIPDSVTQIGEEAFSRCTGLSEIIMEPTAAPTIYDDTFSNTNAGLTFYVPKGGTGYDSGVWKNLNTVEYSPVMSISLPAMLELRPNGSGTLTATFIPSDARFKEIIWESSDTNIVAVDQDGNVTAGSNGTATITATSRQGRKTATCAVTVKTDSSGGGGNSGSSNRGGGSSHYIITTPEPPKPNNPVLAVIELPVSVGNGTATGKPDDRRTASAIAEAGKDAKAKTNGIAVQYDAKTSLTYDGFSIVIARTTLDRLIDAKVQYVTLNTGVVNMTFDLAALQEIQKQATGDITLTAARETGLAGNALAAVGSRPAYRLTVNYTGKDGKAATVDSFGAGRVTVGLAYKPAVTEQTGSLYLVYSADGKGAEWLYQSSYDKNSGNVIGDLGHFSVYGVGYKTAPAFIDTVGHWAKADIDFVVSRGLFSGTSETTFTPNGTITRGMFVTALGRLAGIDPAAYPSSRFNDVAATAYYAPFVEWAASKGIVSGTGEKTFSPDTPITREQMAVIMQRYAQKLGYTLPVAREAVTFTDDSQITGSMKDAVQAIQQAGIMSGIPQGTLSSADGGIHLEGSSRFAPKDAATRAEAAAVLRRFVEIVIAPATAGGWGQNDAVK